MTAKVTGEIFLILSKSNSCRILDGKKYCELSMNNLKYILHGEFLRSSIENCWLAVSFRHNSEMIL